MVLEGPAAGYLPAMPFRTTLTSAAATAGGAVLATATRAVSAVRPARKPLHPRGRVVVARLHRRGLEPGIGVPWLDASGADEVLVRTSRAIGLPDALPDIHGLAIRVPLDGLGGGGDFGDLLFASTGWGRLTRFLLTPSRTMGSRPMTTLLPYRSVAGPIHLGARMAGAETIELSCSVDSGEWQHFADLRLSQQDAGDPTISFDPVENALPGLGQYAWVRRLREPAYDEARASRS